MNLPTLGVVMNERQVNRTCAILAAILWTLAATMMGFALDGSADQLAEPALLLGLVACVPTAHLVMAYTVRQSRERLVRELDGIVARHRAELMKTVLEVIGREDAGRLLPKIGDRR